MSYLRGVLSGLLFCSLMLLSVAAVSAQDAPKKSEKAAPAKKAQKAKKPQAKRAKPIVITNELLEEKFGPSRAPAAQPAATPAAAADPSAPPLRTEIAPDAAKPSGKPHAPLSGEDKVKRVAAIEKELETLHKRKLSIQNPYLAGVTKQTDAEDDGSTNEERLQAVNLRIRHLESELAKLRGSR